MLVKKYQNKPSHPPPRFGLIKTVAIATRSRQRKRLRSQRSGLRRLR